MSVKVRSTKIRSAKVRSARSALAVVILCGPFAGACQPTVRIEAPRDPIVINLNIRLDADVRIRLEDQAREDVAANPGIF